MKKKQTLLYQLVAEDLGSVGGPMGTERVEHLGDWLFVPLPGRDVGLQAAEFAKKRFKINYDAQHGGLPQRMAIGRYYDCLHVGLRLKRVRVQK